MAKKTLNTMAIANELQHSAFFPTASPAAPAPPSPSARVAPSTTSPVTTVPPPQAPQAPQPLRDPAAVPDEVDVVDDVVAPSYPVEPRTISKPLILPMSSTMTSQPAMPASSHASPDASMLAEIHERQQMGENRDRSNRIDEEREVRADQRELADTGGNNNIGTKKVIEAIRRSVRHIGKEVSFVRLTPEEKRQLVDIAYIYKSQGIKTSENEISRIGINWMLEDYQANGANSLLAQVLAALNA